MSDPSRDLDSLFLAALEIESPSERAAFVSRCCGDDLGLRRELEEMLASHQVAGSFLEQPAWGFERTMVAPASDESRAASLDAGLALSLGREAAVFLGDANHSVLRMLSNTLNEVPHVSLRESEADGAGPITRPGSPEMPPSNADGRYRLDGEIARGGMGAIIKGRDTDLGRDLAIKVLLDSHKDKPEVVQRFVEEAQIGGQLQHPGIAPIYELGQFADKRPFFSMKLVKGQTLSKLLADRENAADERGKMIGIFEQICQTMAYAHSRGVIHRDLKPANIMVGAFGEVQVMDWGLAKVLQIGGVADEKRSMLQHEQSIIQTLRSGVGSDAPHFGSAGSQTQMGSVMGTPAYMPPEQALGEIDHLDERADVFGLGAILCEILTGQPPYVAEDGTLVFRMASRGKLGDALSRLEACGADEDLIALAKDCLELEPIDRPRDAGVLAERVTGYLESVEEKLRESEVQRAAEAARADAEEAQADAERERAKAQAARAEAESARASEERKRRRTSLALAASMLLLIGLGSGGWLYVERQNTNRQTAEAIAQREHAVAMQKLADQRDEQRKQAERERIAAVAAEQFAEAEEEKAKRLLYTTDMDTAIEAWTRGEIKRVREKLAVHQRDPHRGFEYRYLMDKIASVDHGTEYRGPFQTRKMTVSSDGRLLATTAGLWDVGVLQVYDAQSLKQRVSIGDIQSRLLVFLPGSHTLVFVDGNRGLRVMDFTDVETPREIKSLATQGLGNPVALVLSRDKTVLAASDGRRVQLWSVPDLQPLGESRTVVPESAGAFETGQPPALFVDGQKVRLALYRGTHVFVADGEQVREFRAGDSTGKQTLHFAHTAQIKSLCFSPDGEWLATGSNDGTVKLWRVATGVLQHDLRDHGAITTAKFTDDGQLLVSASEDRTIRVWNVEDGRPVGVLRGHEGTPEHLATTPGETLDDRHILSSAGGNLRRWPLAAASDGDARIFPGHQSWIWRVRVCPNSRLLGSIEFDEHMFHLRDLKTGRLLKKVPISKSSNLRMWSAFSPQGDKLAVVDLLPNSESRVRLWRIEEDREDGIRLTDLQTETQGSEWTTTECDLQNPFFSGDGNSLLFTTSGGLARLDLSAGNLDTMLDARFNDDNGRWLGVSEGAAIFRLKNEPNEDVLGKVVDKFTLEVGSDRVPIRILQGKKVGLLFHICNQMSMLSPDKRYLGIARESNLRLWDLTQPGQPAFDLPGHLGKIWSIAFSPDGTTMATASADQTIRLWNLHSKSQIAVLRGHSGPVSTVAFTPDGSALISGGADATVRVWQALPREQAENDDLTTNRPDSPQGISLSFGEIAANPELGLE